MEQKWLRTPEPLFKVFFFPFPDCKILPLYTALMTMTFKETMLTFHQSCCIFQEPIRNTTKCVGRGGRQIPETPRIWGKALSTGKHCSLSHKVGIYTFRP